MNSINDPSKKTSINSLLNPQEKSAAYPQGHLVALSPGIPAQPHDPQATAGYAVASYPNPNAFNLRAASWGDMPDEATRRKLDAANGSPLRQYQQPHLNASPGYPEHPAPRMIRPRIDESGNFPVEGAQWPQQDIANMPYGPPIIPSMYSDERTPLSGDHQAHNNYPQAGYHDPSNPPQSGYLPFQNLASRGTIQEQQQQQPHPEARYAYYQGPPVYGVPYQPQQLQQQQHHPHQVQSPQQQQQQQSPSQAPQVPEKRPLPDADDAPAPPKAKRAKAKPKATNADGTTGPSKRGYNAKKRSEAAQIAAQNAQLMPTVSYTQVPSEKGKEKAPDARMQIVSGNGLPGGEASGPLHPELQFARCMSNRYRSEQFPRCVSCTRRWAGDTCRFQGIRFFLKDQQRNIVGISFVESQKADAPSMNFPTRWNVDLGKSHIKRTKRTIAEALLPTLRQELEHLSMSEIIRRPRESEVRATCDTCMTSIFSSSWMCRLCGREACAECFSQVRDLTVDRPGANQAEMAALQARREKHAHSNPFFLSCTRRNEHQAKDFSPMSRFCKEELGKTIEDMERLMSENVEESGDAAGAGTEAGVLIGEDEVEYEEFGDGIVHGLRPGAVAHGNGQNGVNGSGNGAVVGSGELARAGGMTSQHVPGSLADGLGVFSPPAAPAAAPISSGSTFRIPSWKIRTFTEEELTDEMFRAVWARGEPLVVTGLMHKFKIEWTPAHFMEQYNAQSCLIIECQTDVNRRVTVGEFFGWFGKYEDREQCWKLKDWPPSTDFKTAFPELYEDFSNAVPVPNYVRRDGVLNIASHFPSNTIAPDLGPKMYNAMASSQKPGSKGSTRLHMDMADALNIMTYASPRADGSEGCAAWDLFKAEDSDKIRAFLRKKFQGAFQHDPIHSQQFYLDEKLRRELAEECGVKSYRHYQRPGEAVFIPAGCAHQVANLSDCVKVAVDFVSPENIERCEKLTREFREQNQSMVWKEDVLQLRTMMWFAWLSCCQQEEEIV